MENKELEKKDVKVGAFHITGSYYGKDRVTHGTQDNYAGFCLLENNGKMYLCNLQKIEISTTDGPSYVIEECDLYDNIYQMTQPKGIHIDPEDYKLHVSYTHIDNCTLINEDGTLSAEEFHYDEEMENVDVTVYRKEYVGEDAYEEELAFLYDEDDYEEREEELSSGNIPYGEVNGNIYEKDDKVYIEVYGKVFDLDEIINPKQKNDNSIGQDNEIIEDGLTLSQKAEMKQQKLENIKELKESMQKAEELYEQTSGALSAEQKVIDGKKSEKGIEI